jgi:hypothetical protein
MPDNRRTFDFGAVLAALFFSAALISGCAGGALPGGAAPGGDDPEALALLRSVYERNRDVPTTAVRGDVSYSRGSERWFFRFEFIGERPDRFLFTVLDPAGASAYRVLSGPAEMRAADYRQRVFYRGPAAEYPLEAFVKAPITAPELFALLSGQIPAEPLSARPESPITPGAKTARYVFQARGKASDIWRAQLAGPGFGPSDSPALTELSRGPRGRPEFLVRYDKWGSCLREDTGSSAPFPEALGAQWRGAPPTLLRVTYTEVRLGFAMPQGVLALDPPEGFQIQLL